MSERFSTKSILSRKNDHNRNQKPISYTNSNITIRISCNANYAFPFTISVSNSKLYKLNSIVRVPNLFFIRKRMHVEQMSIVQIQTDYIESPIRNRFHTAQALCHSNKAYNGTGIAPIHIIVRSWPLIISSFAFPLNGRSKISISFLLVLIVGKFAR